MLARPIGGAAAALALSAAFLCVPTTVAAAQLFVAANHGASGATLRSFLGRPPWLPWKPPLAIDPDTVLRVRGNRVYALSQRVGTIHVIARRAWEVRRTIELGADSRPQDIVVIHRHLAYVTTAASPRLVRIDPAAGLAQDATDLSVFADDDGNPDLGTMIVDDGNLYVQVRRTNEKSGFAAPAYLAVVDLETETLVDVDPVSAGMQAIELDGTSPKHRMQILPGSRKLLVSATGGSFDAGGIESIDLSTMLSEGLVLREDDALTGSDLGPFVVIDEDRGYLVFTTDFTLSSHLDRFSIDAGVAENVNLHVSVDYAVPGFGFDSTRGHLFVPDGAFDVHGVHVFDTANDERLTDTPLDVEGPATDVLFFRAHAASAR